MQETEKYVIFVDGMRVRKGILLLVALAWAGATASAQFVTYGDDPGGVRWRQIRTDAFRLVFPAGMDSLARTYLGALEWYRPMVGASLGMAPGQFQWGPTPVILHPYNPYANGSVTWAPRRMDLYPVQDPYASDPTPWPFQLAIHESRHLAQMQFGYRKPLRYGHFILGEMWHGLLDGLFVDMPVFEGDAVLAETALTRSGRGRTADFLNYYQVAFDAGDWRNWYQWRYGSFKRMAPDYYTTGYMTFAGMRAFYDKPSFSRDYFNDIVRRPLPWKNLQRAMSRASGESFSRTWRHIQEEFNTLWQKEAEERAPFLPAQAITETPEFETHYEGLAVLDGALYALKRGKVQARRLVRLEPDWAAAREGGEDGVPAWKETDCGAFAAHTGDLVADPVRHRLYWSETVDDVRWSLSGTSRIRWMGPDGARHDLTKENRYYNPAPSPDGTMIAAVEYPYEGGSPLVVLDADDGSVRARYPAPPGFYQLTEPAWLGDTLYVLGLARRGFALWRHSGKGWECCLRPTGQKMQQLWAADGRLTYVSDRNGVNEYYAYAPVAGKAEQLTSTRYGGRDFVVADDWLFYTALAPNGRMVYIAGRDEVRPRSVDPLQVHSWVVADKLSKQENEVSSQWIKEVGDSTLRSLIHISHDKELESKPYCKALHLLHFHSWLPLYFNYDTVESMSFDLTYNTVSLGATGFFQNDLGTATGFLGYSAHKDPYEEGHWRHSLHGKFTYTGLYPVLEASWDLNDRAAIRDVRRVDAATGEKKTVGFLSSSLPVLSGSLRAYIPWRFNKGGILRGLVPQVRWTFGNDVFSTDELTFDASRFYGSSRPASFVGYKAGENVPFQTVTASLRGYTMLQTASSQVYPRFGVGAEAGVHLRPGLSQLYSPSIYGYLYGYLPGFRAEQGLRLSAIGRKTLNRESEIPYLSLVTYPRGFVSAEASRAFGDASFTTKATLDYAIPLYFGDISALSPFVYIRNFLLTPHFDLAYFCDKTPEEAAPAKTPVPGVPRLRESGTLFSAGFDLAVKTGNVLWIPFDGTIGFTLDCLGGSAFAATGANRIYVGALFSMDI